VLGYLRAISLYWVAYDIDVRQPEQGYGKDGRSNLPISRGYVQQEISDFSLSGSPWPFTAFDTAHLLATNPVEVVLPVASGTFGQRQTSSA
jgi:hypothetical protein